MANGVAGKITIRQATNRDVETVSAILQEAARWLENAGMPLWRDEELSSAKIAPDVCAGLYHLAEYSEGVGGTVRFQLEDSVVWPEAPEHEAAYIHRLAIRRRYAGTGLSAFILHWAVQRTHILGRRYLRLDCVASRPRLRAIYESFGFQHYDDRQVGPYCVSRYQYDATKQAES
jgi:GNAT superfamily N-acetyltransferase